MEGVKDMFTIWYQSVSRMHNISIQPNLHYILYSLHNDWATCNSFLTYVWSYMWWLDWRVNPVKYNNLPSMAWHGMEWHDLAWDGMAWHGMGSILGIYFWSLIYFCLSIKIKATPFHSPPLAHSATLNQYNFNQQSIQYNLIKKHYRYSRSFDQTIKFSWSLTV